METHPRALCLAYAINTKLSSLLPPNVLIEEGLACLNASSEPVKRHC